MNSGKVYFIECAGRIKIGFSTNVKSRMAQLATSASSPLTLVNQIDGTFHLERAIHKHLWSHRVKGEWFNDCAAVRAVIDDLVARGPSAIGYVEESRRPPREPSQIQAGITNLIKQNRPHGVKPWEMLSAIAGIKERAAKYRLANRSSYTVDELRLLMRGEDGFEYLKMVMADKRPPWYVEMLAAEAEQEAGRPRAYAGRER